jgi:hypothetical protein
MPELPRSLTAALHQEEDWYIAQCLEVDVASQGHTIDEALAVTRCTEIGQGGWPSSRNMASLSAARSRRNREPSELGRSDTVDGHGRPEHSS